MFVAESDLGRSLPTPADRLAKILLRAGIAAQKSVMQDRVRAAKPVLEPRYHVGR